MADYTTVSAVKDYLRIGGDDASLAGLVTRASAMIDDYCGRWFTPIISTRSFATRGNHITGRLLLLDADLLAVSAITLGDGVTLSPASFILRPVSWPPFFGVSLKQTSGLRWGGVAGPILISGTWGYAVTTPEPVSAAAVRLAAWLYRQPVDQPKAAPPADRLPVEIRQLLGPYVRLRMSVYSGAA